MQRDRERLAANRGFVRTQSYHADKMVKPEVAARQVAAANQYKAALEALFDKKPDAAERVEKLAGVHVPRVVGVAQESSPQGAGRQLLLRKIEAAQGSKSISDAVDAFISAGYELPDDQDVLVQTLEHRDESRVRAALEALGKILAGQVARRKPVLLQRLRRLEDAAEEVETREAASTLRRIVV